MNVVTTLQIGLSVVGVFAALWFYPHCIRPVLGMSGARPLAFLIAFGACVVFAVVETIQIVGITGINVGSIRSLGGWPSLFWVGMLLVLVMIVAWIRPGWLIRVTGGQDPTVMGRYLMDWASRRWAAAGSNEQLQHSTMEMFVRAIESRGLATSVLSQEDPILAYVASSEETGAMSARHRAVQERLASIRPFDPVSWVRVRRRRRALTPSDHP